MQNITGRSQEQSEGHRAHTHYTGTQTHSCSVFTSINTTKYPPHSPQPHMDPIDTKPLHDIIFIHAEHYWKVTGTVRGPQGP